MLNYLTSTSSVQESAARGIPRKVPDKKYTCPELIDVVLETITVARPDYWIYPENPFFSGTGFRSLSRKA